MGRVALALGHPVGQPPACLLAWHAWEGSIHAHLQGMYWVNGLNKRGPSCSSPTLPNFFRFPLILRPVPMETRVVARGGRSDQNVVP